MESNGITNLYIINYVSIILLYMMQIILIVSYAILYTCIGIILYGILLATLYKQYYY